MNQQEAIVKIRKLFALADSPNANEAKAALMQAHRLMAKWNIDALEADQEEIEHITEESKGGNTKYYISLAQVIASNFRCKFYTKGNRIVFFGRTEDVTAAKESYDYAYKFIMRETNRRYKEAMEYYGTGKGIKNSYAYGFILGLKEALEQQSVALMVVTPKDTLDAFRDHTSEGFRTVKRRTTRYYQDENYTDGFHDGRTSMTKRVGVV